MCVCVCVHKAHKTEPIFMQDIPLISKLAQHTHKCTHLHVSLGVNCHSLKQNEVQSACAESAKDRVQTQTMSLVQFMYLVLGSQIFVFLFV